ncbi:MAG TPA: 1-acyl-sn-glycerol-3-phosphate acyltransferase [Gemmatimonadaceae bacterium]|nr:1-acyl-sn-glycerol-3-phosphate acyltransferase [Gemmatimonadaceae bacterium]
MLYVVFRGLARVALRWFYRDVTVVGGDRIPRDAPLLIAVNHPNALVDALVAVSVVPRRVMLTAKATLWEHPLLALLLPRVGIVPLRRAQDERRREQGPGTRGQGGGSPGREAGGGNDAAREATVVPEREAGAIVRSGGAPRPVGSALPPIAPSGDGTMTPAEPGSTNVSPGGAPEPARNAASFVALLDALAGGGAVLIFPEGRSHSEPQLAPLRTGLARIALQARDERGVHDLQVVPVGLVFERKWQPRSRVLVQVGEPLLLDGWVPPTGARPVEALTAEVDARLRAVTLNFETAKEEAQTLAVSRALAAAFEGDRPLGQAETPLTAAVAVAHRVEAARERLAAGGTLPPRAAHFLERVAALRQLAARYGVLLEDAEIATGFLPGARFTLREGLLALVALPIALWGAVNHFLPLRLAWTLGRRSSRNPDDPAMRTIVAGVALTLLAYLLQGAVVWWLAGPWWALLYLATLPPAGVVRLRVQDRLRRAARRAHAYRLFRRQPTLRQRFADELAWVRREAVEIERD